jgi:outer membrane protein TolC
MAIFRHFVAVGVGAAIALSLVESGTSTELPSLKQPRRNSAKNEDQEPLTALTSQLFTSAVPTQEEDDRIPSRDTDAQSIADHLPASEPIRSEELYQEKENEKNSVTTGRGVAFSVTALTPEINSGAVGNWSTGQYSSDSPIYPSPYSFIPVSQTDQKSKRPQASDGESWRTTKSVQYSQSPTASRGYNSQLQDGAIVAQSPRSDGKTPVPEYLNPNPNPLLFPTESQEVQIRATQPITLQQAIELAERNNRNLQEAQLTLESNQAAVREARAAEFPTASVGADFTRSDSAQAEISNRSRANNPFAQLNNPISASFTGLLELSYDLFTAGRRPAQIRQAEERVRFQQLEVERISEQLRLDVTRAYYSLQEADAQVDIFQAAVRAALQSLRDAQLLEQAGLGTRFDVLQAEVDLASSQQDLTRSLSQQLIARRQIAQLLSLPQTVAVTAADPIAVAGNWPLSLEQSIVLGYKNRAELEQQLVQREISEQERRLALSAIRPQASLSAGYNIVGNLNDQEGPGDGFTLGARLRWNFFDGGAALARAEQARRNIAIAETRFAAQRNQVRFDVEEAFFTLNANAQNIETATIALQRAEESLRLARLRFQAGVGTQTDVLNQQTALTQARFNQLRAILDYNRALADLQRATSNLPASNLNQVR